MIIGKGLNVSTLISILRAVHCRSTHHFFAIDALDRIDTPNGRRLASVLLANYQEYLNGAKDPDTKFKDFQNHVIHVNDNNWGGAPKACETWLARVIEKMHNSDWIGAAYSIGVLSHYFTDPLMPLHTAQHPSEAVVHRPLEWSVCKSYDWIFRRCTNQVSIPIEGGPGWMSKAVLAGAAIAHKHYLPLIEYYDLNKGVKDPPAGLDSRSRVILSEIFDYTLTGWARILDRIAALAVVEIPICPLTFTTVMATVNVPAAWVVGRFTDAAEQRAVKAIFDEYQATGRVVKNLPAEIRTVASNKPLPAASLLPEPPLPVPVASPPQAPITEIIAYDQPDQEQPLGKAPLHQTPVLQVVSPAQSEKFTTSNSEPRAIPLISESESIEFVPLVESVKRDDRASNPTTPGANEAKHPPLSATSPVSSRGARVSMDSDIVDAPSIGPKTAARFNQVGIDTIRQFLSNSAADTATLLDVSWVDESTLNDWQDQARLVVDVPALCGYKAQLLVGIDCRSADELASFEIEALHYAMRKFCRSDAGARILRSAAIPSQDEVASWIESAAHCAARNVA